MFWSRFWRTAAVPALYTCTHAQHDVTSASHLYIGMYTSPGLFVYQLQHRQRLLPFDWWQMHAVGSWQWFWTEVLWPPTTKVCVLGFSFCFQSNPCSELRGRHVLTKMEDALDTVHGKDVPTHSKIDVTMSDGAHAFPRGIEVLQIHPECPVAGDHTSICFHLHRQGQSTRSSITHIDIFRHLIYSTAHSTVNARSSTCNLHFIKCWNIRETCPYHSKAPKSSLISENGFAPNRRHAFIWTNAYPVHWSYMLRSASTN